MRAFKKIGIAGLILCSAVWFAPLHAQDEDAGAAPAQDEGAMAAPAGDGGSQYAAMAQSLGCPQLVTNAIDENGASHLAFVPAGQSAENATRMLRVSLSYLSVNEDHDFDDAATEAKDAFIDGIEEKSKITVKKEGERANGSPVLYVEFKSGKGDKAMAGAAVFGIEPSGAALTTQFSAHGAALDDASKAVLKQSYAGMAGK